MEHSLPIIVLFIGNYSFSYLPIFNRVVNIYRDDKYIVITDGGKQLHFVLSVNEKDFYSKYKEWNSVNG